jgi:hypothetical protein
MIRGTERTCTRRCLKRNPPISHSNPFLRHLSIRAFAQVYIRHVFPGTFRSRIHTERRARELDLGLVVLDVPMLLGLGGEGLTLNVCKTRICFTSCTDDGYLHHESTSVGASLGYDHVFGVLLGRDVDGAIAFGYSGLGERCRGKRERGESCEQHLDRRAFTTAW